MVASATSFQDLTTTTFLESKPEQVTGKCKRCWVLIICQEYYQRTTGGGGTEEGWANTPLPGLIFTAPHSALYRARDRQQTFTANSNTCTLQKYQPNANNPAEVDVYIYGKPNRNLHFLAWVLVARCQRRFSGLTSTAATQSFVFRFLGYLASPSSDNFNLLVLWVKNSKLLLYFIFSVVHCRKVRDI